MNTCKTGSCKLPVLRFLPFVLSLTFPFVLSFILSFVLSLSKDESETIHINSLPRPLARSGNRFMPLISGP
jgi:hypothetical protein